MRKLQRAPRLCQVPGAQYNEGTQLLAHAYFASHFVKLSVTMTSSYLDVRDFPFGGNMITASKARLSASVMLICLVTVGCDRSKESANEARSKPSTLPSSISSQTTHADLPIVKSAKDNQLPATQTASNSGVPATQSGRESGQIAEERELGQLRTRLGVLFSSDAVRAKLTSVQQLKLDDIKNTFVTRQKAWKASGSRREALLPLMEELATKAFAILDDEQRAAVEVVARMDENELENVAERAHRVMCDANKKQILNGALLYASEHKGALPPDLGTLLLEDDIVLNWVVCPSSGTVIPNDLVTEGREVQAAWVNAHADYIWLGAGKKAADVDAGVDSLKEKPGNHR